MVTMLRVSHLQVSPVSTVKYPHSVRSLVSQNKLDNALTSPSGENEIVFFVIFRKSESPDSKVQGSGAHSVQGVNVCLVLYQELEHLVSAIEGRVVERGLVTLIPSVHTEAAGAKQDPDYLGDSLKMENIKIKV